jgi:hypothetical protein
MKNFLLTSTEDNEPIAVISKEGKTTPSEFNRAIALAINEHYIMEKTNVSRFEDEMTFEAISVCEDDFTHIRDFILEEIAVY